MSKTILVVEDEKAIADILVFNLQREGYQTLEANNGADGLKLALENPLTLYCLMLCFLRWTVLKYVKGCV